MCFYDVWRSAVYVIWTATGLFLTIWFFVQNYVSLQLDTPLNVILNPIILHTAAVIALHCFAAA